MVPTGTVENFFDGRVTLHNMAEFAVTRVSCTGPFIYVELQLFGDRPENIVSAEVSSTSGEFKENLTLDLVPTEKVITNPKLKLQAALPGGLGKLCGIIPL